MGAKKSVLVRVCHGSVLGPKGPKGPKGLMGAETPI